MSSHEVNLERVKGSGGTSVRDPGPAARHRPGEVRRTSARGTGGRGEDVEGREGERRGT